ESFRRAAKGGLHRGAACARPRTNRTGPGWSGGGGDRARHPRRDHRGPFRGIRRLDARGSGLGSPASPIPRLRRGLRHKWGRALPEAAGLLAVAAGGHAAPAAGVVLGTVIEGPTAAV